MPGFMDKVKAAAGGVAEATKKGAATAQTKAKIHGLRNKVDEDAQRLGYLVYRERTGGDAGGADADELVKQIGELEAEIAKLEAEPGEGGGAEPGQPEPSAE